MIQRCCQVCVGSFKVCAFWRIQHECGIIFGESEQHRTSIYLFFFVLAHSKETAINSNSFPLSLVYHLVSWVKSIKENSADVLTFFFLLYCGLYVVFGNAEACGVNLIGFMKLEILGSEWRWWDWLLILLIRSILITVLPILGYPQF